MYTTAYQWSLSWARYIQSTPSHIISLRSILILSIFTLVFCVVSSLQAFWPKYCVHSSCLPCIACYMPHPSHPPWLDCLKNIWWNDKLWSSLLCSSLEHPDTFSLPIQIFSSAPGSNTLNLCSSFGVTDQVLCPHKTTGTTIVL